MEPKRIQLKRVKGWRKPEGAVKVARGATIGWGNPYKEGVHGTREEVVAMYEDALVNGRLPYSIEDVKRELAGKNLACWCKSGDLCHGDVLLKYANEGR